MKTIAVDTLDGPNRSHDPKVVRPNPIPAKQEPFGTAPNALSRIRPLTASSMRRSAPTGAGPPGCLSLRGSGLWSSGSLITPEVFVSVACNRFVSTDRDGDDDAEARRWAREMRESLEQDEIPDDSGALADRLAEERARRDAQQ